MSDEKRVIGRPWQRGESGNPAGRPIGTRNRFSEAFVGDIAAAWEKHGTGVVERVLRNEPTRFLEVCSRLIPRDVSVTLSTRLPGSLEPDDWSALLELLGAVRTALPGDDRKPGEIAQFVKDAIRSHGAKLVEQ